jgi:hypothetical protein
MALTIKTEQSQVILTTERTHELHVHNKLGEPQQIHAMREQVEMNGEQVKKWLASTIEVKRTFADVSAETIALAGSEGTLVTVAQLWATVATLIDRWAMEDRPALAEQVASANPPGGGGQ